LQLLALSFLLAAGRRKANFRAMSDVSHNPIEMNASTPSSLDPVAICAALSAPSRWQMIGQLADGKELSASEMKTLVGGTLENVSKHLRTLRDAGVISSRYGRDGRAALYMIPHEFRMQLGVLHFGSCAFRVANARSTGGKD
jgi:DNA-binding transcriptional ArsR family regulator